MNPKSNTRSRYFGGNQPRRDKFRGFKGRVRKKQLHQSKQKPWQIMDEEIKDLRTKYSQVNSSKVKKFTDLPLSKKTLQGLKFAKYESPTDIQRESIGLALQGNDILGAAKTGSGKTLAFLIPVLENLFLQKWSALDGLGALIISPTRELAYQTFEVLKKLGKFHDFSAGLVIGGKLLKEESARINRTNIVICTPGRLLQHMDETVNFSADSLQILVLDEADRILDLGFAKDMNAIIENLPSERQTLLFSATQTKSVKDLARLSLKDPMFVSVHENAQHSTPSQLEQNYIICELHDKISMLWSFVKNHLKSKVLVFMASCKQVKFVYEVFRHLRPGVSVMALHGGMHQLKRVAAYNQFCRKKHAVLFATDIAARGLDFPAVNWVVQLDCPEDANTYIHRAGRTARYEKDGESLLILLPSEEEAMVKQLTEKKIPIDKIKINMRKLWNIQPKLESSLAANPTLKDTAQRAFLGYLRSVFLMSNKQVFNIHKLNTDDFARSLGLAIPPKVRFLKREQKRLEEKEAKKLSAKLQSENVKNKTEDSESEGQESEDSESDTDSESENESDSDIEERVRDSDKIRQGVGSGSSDESDNENSDNSDGQDSEESGSEDGGNVQSKSSPQKLKTEKSNNEKNNRTSKAKDDNVLTFHVDDDGDELFSVKRTILSSDSEESESEESSSKGDNLKNKKKEKQTTKFAVAKKLLKKNLKVNTKIVFDEAGNEVQDVMKKPQAVSKPDDYEGGIDLKAAKQRMLEEDKFDKQLYRERIKQKHKEERIKKKEKMRGKKKADTEETEGEEVVAILGTGGEDDAMEEDIDSDEMKIRAMDNGSSDTDQEDSDDESPVKKMRRMEESVSLGSDTDDEDEDNDEDDYSSDEDVNDVDNDIDTGLALEDDEEIALRLLQG